MSEHDMARLAPGPAAATRMTSVMRQHPRWSVFWDKRYAVWRAAEDDPDSDLYTESPDAHVVIKYITANVNHETL
jgi:hypothetical protein